jgi:chromosomal replication initiation ATPase DnaA
VSAAPAHPQATLGLPSPGRPAQRREDFILSPANAHAAALTAQWREWPQARLALCGPAGSGKTHLTHVFMAESGAARIDAAALRAETAPALLARGALAVEDVDRMGAGAEAALFHLMNLARQQRAALLLTGRPAPARWPVSLPDLASRLAALTPARLSPPDDALLEAVIAKAFVDRSLTFEPALPRWLALRIERSFAAAHAAVARLDAESLARHRPLTRRLAAELLPA